MPGATGRPAPSPQEPGQVPIPAAPYSTDLEVTQATKPRVDRRNLKIGADGLGPQRPILPWGSVPGAPARPRSPQEPGPGADPAAPVLADVEVMQALRGVSTGITSRSARRWPCSA